MFWLWAWITWKKVHGDLLSFFKAVGALWRAPEHKGQEESTTTDEIERAYHIVTTRAGHISNIIMGLVRMWRMSDLWHHLRLHLGRTTLSINGRGQCTPPGPIYKASPLHHTSSSSSSCISTKPVYSTSSVTWLMLSPVLSDIATRVRLRSGWMVALSTGRFS